MRKFGWLGKLLLAGAMCSAVAGTSGCKSLLKKKSDAGAGTSSGGVASAQDDADEQLQEKLDEYIKCLNSLSSAIHQSRHRYFTYIPKTGPTGRETFADLYRLPVGATATCSAGISRSKMMPPSDPKLESAGSEFASAASSIDVLMNEADRYYENRDFRDDHWLKGKLMHPRLMSAWDRFSKADKQLHDTLDGITKPLAQRVLGRIEREDGQKFRYFRKKTLITARELVEATTRTARTGRSRARTTRSSSKRRATSRRPRRTSGAASATRRRARARPPGRSTSTR
jgi:hypothetical protein